MDRLKKIFSQKVKGSSLVETIVATVVIMIVFGIAVATIGNILERNVKSSTSFIDKELNKLVYLYQNKKIQVPEIRELDKWTIELEKKQEGNLSYVVFNAKHKVNLKEKVEKSLNANKKIHAFTLTELLVVLVISSIVISLAFLGLNHVQRQVRLINQTFEKQQKVIKLERLLNADLNTHKARYDKQRRILFLENQKDTVVYQFLQNQIIRDKDSISLDAQNMLLYLDGEIVSSGNIDAIEFSFSDTYSQKGFFVYKRKDASHYMNR